MVEYAKQWARWRIGYGDSISIWNDSWLPKIDHPFIRSPIIDGFQEWRIGDLILQESRTWDLLG